MIDEASGVTNLRFILLLRPIMEYVLIGFLFSKT